MLSRFNKFLIKKWLAEESNWQVKMLKLFDYKVITKEFNENEKLMKRYFIKRKQSVSEANSLKIRNNILFY